MHSPAAAAIICIIAIVVLLYFAFVKKNASSSLPYPEHPKPRDQNRPDDPGSQNGRNP